MGASLTFMNANTKSKYIGAASAVLVVTAFLNLQSSTHAPSDAGLVPWLVRAWYVVAIVAGIGLFLGRRGFWFVALAVLATEALLEVVGAFIMLTSDHARFAIAFLPRLALSVAAVFCLLRARGEGSDVRSTGGEPLS